MKKRLFISHAVKDKALADALVDLLQTGANISADDIFCSSLEGLGIPSGKNFIEYIKSQLQEPDTVIVILSPNYYESHFCLCELGATWAMSHNLLPLIVPPLTYNDIKGVISSIQIPKINDSDMLNEFITELTNHLDIKFNLARWDIKKKGFLEKLPALLKSLPTTKTVSPEKHKELEDLLTQSQEALSESEQEISGLQAKIKKLKKCKDANEVKGVEKEFLSDQEVFDELVEKIKENLDKLPRVITYFLFKKFMGQNEVKINAFEERDLLNDAGDAAEEGYLDNDEGVFSLNEGDRKVKNAITTINSLDNFITDDSSEEFLEFFEEENDYAISVTNKRFWRDHLSTGYCYL